VYASTVLITKKKGVYAHVNQDFALSIVLVVAGLLILAFGIANEFSNGWQPDIVNLSVELLRD
jgi:hypothetical protein